MVNSTNHNYRKQILNELPELGNHHIRLTDYNVSSTTATFSISQNNYWKWRIKSDTEITIAPSSGETSVFDNSSGWNISSLNSTDNLIGSRWALSGGSGEFNVEFLITQQATYSNAYFAWDLDPISSTYIFVEIGVGEDNGRVSWIVDGVSMTQSTFGAPYYVKIIWDKNTGVSEFRRSDTIDNPNFNQLVATYSITKTQAPFFYWSFLYGNETEPYLFINRLSIANHQTSATSSSYHLGVSNPPPVKYMMNQNDNY